jgi:hypothetical protein
VPFSWREAFPIPVVQEVPLPTLSGSVREELEVGVGKRPTEDLRVPDQRSRVVEAAQQAGYLRLATGTSNLPVSLIGQRFQRSGELALAVGQAVAGQRQAYSR